MTFVIKTSHSINSLSSFTVFLHIAFLEDAHITVYNIVIITYIILSMMIGWYT